MSDDQFRAFLKQLNEDPSLRASLTERFGDPSEGIEAGELSAFAGEQGYQFRVEEVEGELSDTDLDGVAGGLSAGYKVHWDVGGGVNVLDRASQKFNEGKIEIDRLKSLGFYYTKVPR